MVNKFKHSGQFLPVRRGLRPSREAREPGWRAFGGRRSQAVRPGAADVPAL